MKLIQNGDYIDGKDVTGLGGAPLLGSTFHTPEFLLEHLNSAVELLHNLCDKPSGGYPSLPYSTPPSLDEKRYIGKVLWWDEKKGYGNAEVVGGMEKVWLHYNGLEKYENLLVGEHIQFVLRHSDKLYPEAHHIRLVDRIHPPLAESYMGVVRYWDISKNCGSVYSDKFSSEIIVDHSALPEFVYMLHANDRVEFQYTLKFEAGRDVFIATAVKILPTRKRDHSPSIERPTKRSKLSTGRQAFHRGTVVAWKPFPKGYGFVHVGKHLVEVSGVLQGRFSGFSIME